MTPYEQASSAANASCSFPALASVLDAVPDIFVTFDQEWRFTYANQHTLRTIGKSLNELLGRAIWALYPEFVGTPVEAQLRRAMAEQTPVRFEMPDPVTGLWREVHAYPAPDGLIVHGRDISERRRTEVALRDSEERLRTLMDNVPGAVYRCGGGPDWSVRFIGDAITAISGYPATDFVDNQVRSFTSIIHPADWPAVERRAHEALARREAFEVEYRIVHRDGSLRWVQDHAQGIYGEDGELLWIDGVVLDVTERRQTEEALRQSEERFQLAAEAVDALIYEMDLTRMTVHRSSGLHAVLGFYPQETDEAIEWWLNRIHPDDLPDVIFQSESAYASAQSFDLEYRILHRRGDYVHVWDRGRIVRDRLGRPIRVVGCTVNVTERKRAEAALRESEERHRLLTDLTSDYTYTCRVDPDGSAYLESVSPGFTRITGYQLHEVQQGGGWACFIYPTDLVKLAEQTPLIMANKWVEGEIRILTKKGRIGWVRYSVRPVWDETRKRVVRLLGAAEDITQRKRAEAQREEYAQRLQALSRRLLEVQEQERRHLARELHDEVGQALTGLKLALEMSLQQEGYRRRATLAEAQAQLRELTTRVRDLSLRLRPTMLDDLGLVPALVWLFRRYTAQTGVEVVFQHNGLSERFHPEVETAAFRIVQEALTNVARHASVREATVGLWVDGGRLWVQIEDQGAGFDPKAVHAAAPSSGLSGMQERAVLLGGELTIESVPGTGTCLTAELPIKGREEGSGDAADAVAG
jgi:PAS domain S-box-containing protein